MNPNPTFFQKIKLYISTHKKTAIVAVLVVLFGGYLIIHAATKSTGQVSYVLGTVTQGTVISTVTSTGQVSTSNSVDLKPQVSGNLVAIDAKAGEKVTQGQTLFVIDSTDAARAVKTAQNNLAAAKLDLQSTETSNTNNTSDDSKAVQNAYITLLSSGLQAQPTDTTTASYQLPTITGNYILGTEGSITLTTYSSQGGISFNTSGLVSATGLTNSVTPQPIGDSGLFIQFPSSIKADLTWVINIPNKNSSSYINNENAYETAVENQNENIDPASSAAVTLQSKQLAVVQAQDDLDSAEETLAEYYIKAPFSGTLASVDVGVGDDISGTTLGTIITNQEIVNLSLNEVDVSKVNIGDKATLTFDAIPNLSLTGTVSTIDPVGTVTSGVVNYTVTITLDTQDDRVKSGMSVTAAIQTAVAQDVLTVPNSAVKTTNGTSYVMTVPDGDVSTPVPATGTTTASQSVLLSVAPVRTEVQIGIADTANTQIVSGLTENQSIVIKTVTATAATTTAKATTTAAPSLLGGSAGGATRSFGAAAGR